MLTRRLIGQGMKTRTVTYSSRSWRVRWPVARYFGRGSFSRLGWPPRILAWLLSAGIAGLAGWQYAVLGPVAFEIVFLATVLADARRVRGLSHPVAVANGTQLETVRAEVRRRAALPRVASPGGWSVPAGVRPAWNWSPPPGLEPRLDRVPLWARLWYATPLVDRYAHAWLWHHGGWDVIPPESWAAPPA
jgi:hypothetical protein